jgi:hypothetical protein
MRQLARFARAIAACLIQMQVVGIETAELFQAWDVWNKNPLLAVPMRSRSRNVFKTQDQ